MKIRVVAAAVLLPLLAIAVLVLPKVVTAILFALLSAIAAYELLQGTGFVKHPRLTLYTMLMAALVPIWCYFEQPYAWGLLALLAFFGALFGEMMASHIKIQFEMLAICLFGGILIPFLLSSIVRIQVMDVGRSLVFIPFMLAFTSDSGAYFVGIYFGSHKLAPVISPKKTIEGVIGGVTCTVVGMLLFTLIRGLVFGDQVNYLYAVIYGLACSGGAVFGDLCFSVIKRQTGIKDYGNLIPGHGGVLDRFDSMMIVGPLTEALLLLLPVVV